MLFGRDEDIRRVADRLIERRYVCVVGRSGTGKSSLVAAGALPALRKALPGLSYLRFTPRAIPSPDSPTPSTASCPRGGCAAVRRRGWSVLPMNCAPTQATLGLHLPALAPLLVFADQFEELFTQTPEGSRPAFRAV